MLSIVCPVYNEADNIEQLLDELQNKVSIPAEVLIVYDHDEDNTIPVVRSIAARYSFEIRLVKNKFGIGALNAIKAGFAEANHEAVLVVMADLSDDLGVVDRMYQLIMHEGYDIVCGSRYMKGGRQIGGPFLKKLLSRIAGVSLHYLAGIPTLDVTNSFKMYRRSFLVSTKIESEGGFEVGMELTVKAFVSGLKITELPVTWTDRVAGKSRFQMWRWIPNYMRWYFYALKKFGKKRTV